MAHGTCRVFGSVFRRTAGVALLFQFALIAGAAANQATPLEDAGFRRLPKTAEIAGFLRKLAAKSNRVTFDVFGHSAGNLPMAVVFLSDDPSFPARPARARARTTVLLVGGQHGTEPSGGDALQGIARDVALGPLTGLLESLNLVIVPVSNPDGRDHRRRTNAAGINLSTDFLVQTQPETRALTALVRRVAPDVILDVHESAIYKPSSLGAQGYMTDVEAQFEGPTNPNVAPEIRHVTLGQLVPSAIRRTADSGLRAERYLGEITDINQPVTHGGLTLRNLRNYGGMLGILSVLLENRLDPPGRYPTPRNIRVRVSKQHFGIRAFLSAVAGLRHKIGEARVAAARRWKGVAGHGSVVLVSEYEKDDRAPTIDLPMLVLGKVGKKAPVIRRRVEKTFEYHARIVAKTRVAMPRAYAVTRYRDAISRLLAQHRIRFETLTAGRTERAEIQHVESVRRTAIPYGKIGAMLEIRMTSRFQLTRLAPGDLWIDLNQPLGLLVPLMLDPRSSTSIYQDPAFAAHITAGRDHYALGIE